MVIFGLDVALLAWPLLEISSNPEAVSNRGPMIVLGYACFALFMILIGLILSLALFNLNPEVCIDEEGIYVGFMLDQVSIPWAQVLEVRTRGLFPRRTIVVARRITPLHYIYGWIFGHTLRPCFVISNTLEHQKELIVAIRSRLK